MRRVVWRSMLVVLALSLPAATGCGDGEPEGRAEILWDSWGVPHIFAEDDENLFYAFGQAQMQSHGDLILRLYGEARGRAAEYWGEGYEDDDRLIRTMGVPDRGREWYAAQRPEMRRCLDAFVDGINDYAEANPDFIADEVRVVLPVEPADVLSHLQRVIHLTFVGDNFSAAARRWEARPSTNAGNPRPATTELRGSNAWAIAPERSASGNAMLLANPHLPWSGQFMFYEVQLVGPALDAYGTTLVGMPLIAIGFNQHLGWSHTVNTFDGTDLYELTLADGGYLYDGEVRAFDERTEIYKVKQGDRLEERSLTVRQSIHGPVLAERNGAALAVRMVGLDQPELIGQYWEMIHATGLESFEAALSRLQMPTFNVIYADREGHILYLFGGRTPRRSGGDWFDWQGATAGDSSATLWTETLPYDELPRVVDPPSGWVQNANDPPWSATFPGAPNRSDFPAYLAPAGMPFRPQRSVRMLDEDDSITFDELVTYKMSTRMEFADRILDDLLPAAIELGDELTRRAATVLESWDRSADAESRGALLFARWVAENGRNAFAGGWSESEPRTTPDGLADRRAAVEALERAARSVERDHGALDIAWGELHRLRGAGIDLPGNGGPGRLGIFRVVSYATDPDGGRRAVGGDSFVAAVEFSEPVRAHGLLSYGNASQPHSAHRGDQLELFSRKELRPFWLTRDEIEAHLESRTTLTRPGKR